MSALQILPDYDPGMMDSVDMVKGIDPWFLENLVCPRDKSTLSFDGKFLLSKGGNRYPVVEGVPVMLGFDSSQTIGLAARSLERAIRPDTGDQRAPELYLESVGISDEEKCQLLETRHHLAPDIDPVVAYLVGATCGYAYGHLIGKLREYPVPDIPLPDGSGKQLLDIGCSWGRWSFAAAGKQYRVTGIDPSLGAVMAARRVARQLGISARFIVGDARYLPFRDEMFDWIFSYSVMQHFDEESFHRAISETGRVLRRGGTTKIQMANRLGLRSFYHQIKKGFKKPRLFDVRYRSIRKMKNLFERSIGPSRVRADCFFGLGLQASDSRYMSFTGRNLTRASDLLVRIARFIPKVTFLADSVYLISDKTGKA